MIALLMSKLLVGVAVFAVTYAHHVSMKLSREQFDCKNGSGVQKID